MNSYSFHLLPDGYWLFSEKTEEDLFWEVVNASYAAMKADPVFWSAELKERAYWGSGFAMEDNNE